MHFFKHLNTVTRHRRIVKKLCFRCGLIKQGIFHDLSKFSPSEFFAGAEYYQGNRSPQAKERELFGYSAAWLHHKGRNKHHYEYWFDTEPVEMPPCYLAEMVCDRIAAGKVYAGKNYTDANPLIYLESRTDKSRMHPKTYEKLKYFLELLKEKGEKYTLSEMKKYVKESKHKKSRAK